MFASTVEEAFKEPAVFKEWARSWARRSRIENAIDIVSPTSARTGEKRDSWSTGPHQSHGEGEIDAVTKLVPLERFVFVMSILDRHSNWDCAVLLGCNPNKVAQARRKALRRLCRTQTSFCENRVLEIAADVQVDRRPRANMIWQNRDRND